MSFPSEFTLYFAWSQSGGGKKAFREHDWNKDPLAVLVSFFYLKQFQSESKTFPIKPKRTMLDSGAFSAWNSGKPIDIDQLIAETKDPTWDESVALDDIESHHKSISNAAQMKRSGSPAWPVFHIGEPWSVLADYCAQFPKVGLSCRFGEHPSVSLKWVEQCFARTWPHRFHSFGWVVKEALMLVPWHSADAASWAVGPLCFGNWSRFPLKDRTWPVRGNKFDLRCEIQSYLELERQVQARWQKELKKIK